MCTSLLRGAVPLDFMPAGVAADITRDDPAWDAVQWLRAAPHQFAARVSGVTKQGVKWGKAYSREQRKDGSQRQQHDKR